MKFLLLKTLNCRKIGPNSMQNSPKVNPKIFFWLCPWISHTAPVNNFQWWSMVTKFVKWFLNIKSLRTAGVIDMSSLTVRGRDRLLLSPHTCSPKVPDVQTHLDLWRMFHYL